MIIYFVFSAFISRPTYAVASKRDSMFSFMLWFSSPKTVRVLKTKRMRWARHVARMGRGEVFTGVLLGRTEGKRPLGRPRRRWEDNIKIDLREIWIDGAD
jgi:hypothetical protein